MTFKLGDLVWVRTQYYPLWPCIIEKERHKRKDSQYYLEVRFLGERTKATIIQQDVETFDIDRPEFNPSKQDLKNFKTLSRALSQAQRKWALIKSNISKQKSEKKIEEISNKKQDIKLKQKMIKESKVSNKQKISKNISICSPMKNSKQNQDVLVQSFNQSDQSKQNKKQEQNKEFHFPFTNYSNSQSYQGKLFTSSIYHNIDIGDGKSQMNQLETQANKVPLLSFLYQLPQRPNKKHKYSSKVTERQQYKIDSFSKIISNYMIIPSSNEQKYIRDLKFKLQCIVFNMIDSPSNLSLLQSKLQQLISIFYISKVDYKIIMNNQINSLLSYIHKKLKQIKKFQFESQWLEQTIHQLNEKAVKGLNDCTIYENVEKQKLQSSKLYEHIIEKVILGQQIEQRTNTLKP